MLNVMRIEAGPHRSFTTDGRVLWTDRRLSTSQADLLHQLLDAAVVSPDGTLAVEWHEGQVDIERFQFDDEGRPIFDLRTGEFVVDRVTLRGRGVAISTTGREARTPRCRTSL